MEVVLAGTTFWISDGTEDGEPAHYPGVATLESKGEIYICRIEDADADPSTITLERVTQSVAVPCEFSDGDDDDDGPEEDEEEDEEGEEEEDDPAEIPTAV